MYIGETLADVMTNQTATKVNATWKWINSDSEFVGRLVHLSFQIKIPINEGSTFRCFSVALTDHKEKLPLGRPATIRIIMTDLPREGLKYTVQVRHPITDLDGPFKVCFFPEGT